MNINDPDKVAHRAYLVHTERNMHVQFTWSNDLNTVAITFYEGGFAVGHDGISKPKAKALWTKLVSDNYKKDQHCSTHLTK